MPWATAALVAAVYLVVFGAVTHRVYLDLDTNLRYEVAKHRQEVSLRGGTIRFAHKGEWEEREHREVQVDPVFIQITDSRGQLLDRSPNLKGEQLTFDATPAGRVPFNSTLRGAAIRQVQVRLSQAGGVAGYLLATISAEAPQRELDTLEMVLLVSFPVVLLVLFGIARLLAGRSIAPIAEITATTNRITRNNLSARIALPPRPDELHTLTSAIKYSPAASTIAIGLAQRGVRLRCTIADQGIGICPEDLDKIFDPLYRSDALAHKHIDGTGLGLSIVAKACALLGIELAVRSALGQGTSFTLDFPG